MPWFKLCACEVKFKGAGETALRKPDTGPDLCTSGLEIAKNVCRAQHAAPLRENYNSSRSTGDITVQLSSDEAGVEGACDGGVFCAFEYGAAVGEDRYLVGRDLEAEQEIVVADFGGGIGSERGSRSGRGC
jgi:hypothetical protein